MTHVRRASAYRFKGETDKAIDDLAHAITLNPKDSSPWVERATLWHYSKKDYPKAVADLTEAIRLNPFLASAYVSRGWVYRDWRQPEKELDDYAKAIAADPTWR